MGDCEWTCGIVPERWERAGGNARDGLSGQFGNAAEGMGDHGFPGEFLEVGDQFGGLGKRLEE